MRWSILSSIIGVVGFISTFASVVAFADIPPPPPSAPPVKTCTLRPLGEGRDDTDQVEAAIARCGHFGRTVFEAGEYNITRSVINYLALNSFHDT